MPLNEYPSDESWGYQGTGFYSPTSRYGTADQLRAFVDACHREGIGVILDFVPVHFAVDGYALADYDGTALYEYPHNDVGYSEWGSRNFMHSRGEVRSFLQSAGTSCIPGAKCEASCSRRRNTGSLNTIWTGSGWMPSAGPFTGRACRSGA